MTAPNRGVPRPSGLNYLSKVKLHTKPTALERRMMRLLVDSRLPLHPATDELHKAMLRLAASENSPGGVMNISAAARTLGVQRHTLYRLMRRLGWSP